MWFDIRFSILMVLLVVCPSLQWRFKRQDADFGSEDCSTPKGAPGQCIDIKSCAELLKLLEKHKEPGNTEYLQKSQCGVMINGTVKVCCPDSITDTSVCGRSSVFRSKVVNGVPAQRGAWPWMAALGYSSPTKPLDWLCGGSLISNRHVLTAAHCVTNIGDRKLFVVRLGDLNLDDSVIDGATPTNYTVETFIVHENFDAAAHTDDIGLVKLKEHVQYTNLIRPICVPQQNTFTGDPSDFAPYVAGWGTTYYKGPKISALQEAQIEIADQYTCKEAYKNIKKTTIDDRVICAISSLGSDTCQGDSGGPLMLEDDSNYYLIGVVSYGYKCSVPGYPGVYTRVSTYVDWIRKNIRT